MRTMKLMGKIPGHRKLVKPLSINLFHDTYGYIASAVPLLCWATGESRGEAIKRLRQQLAHDLDWSQVHQYELADYLLEGFRLLQEYIVYRHVPIPGKGKKGSHS